MYFRLAFRNVKKSYRDFLIYFLTLSFSVCLFYTFNSFQEQKAVIDLSTSNDEMVQILVGVMALLSIFVVIVLGFLMLYANNFLIKRRKKEFGIYLLLGMPRFAVSRILIYETIMIGAVSLLTGMFSGLLLSQVLTAITAQMFHAKLNYHFVISPLATIITLVAFVAIFTGLTLLNAVITNHYKLIHLLHAKQKHEFGFIKRFWISVLLFLLAIIALFGAYTIALTDKIQAFDSLPLIICLGSIGTLLFFFSLSGFLLTTIRNSKTMYFKNLNCFVLQQINSNINTNFISMSVTCILLLLSIGALSTGLNLKNTLNNNILISTPYDVSFRLHNYSNSASPDQVMNKVSLDSSYIQDTRIIKLFTSEIDIDHITLDESRGFAYIVSLSDYNQVMKDTGRDAIALKESEVFVFTDNEFYVSSSIQQLKRNKCIKIADKNYSIMNKDYENIKLNTIAIYENMLYIVVEDQQIPTDQSYSEIIYNYKLTTKITPTAFEQYALSLMKPNLPEEHVPFFGNNREDIEASYSGQAVMFTYIGIYLGIVFLIASAVVLAIQQLSQADDNKERYLILHKIGVDHTMRNKAILLQIGTYFMLPLLLAIVHSIVGIQMVNTLVMVYGKGDILVSSLTTGGIFIVIYGSYFLLTYQNFKSIIIR